MDPLAPSLIRYIKLGSGGAWESALDQGRLDWGMPSDLHVFASEGDWDAVAAVYAAASTSKAVATGYTNEARAFYLSDADVMWITFARGRMWWGFAEPGVQVAGGDGSDRGIGYRTIRRGWRDHDIAGAPLLIERLSTRLTRLAGYRRTICGLAPDQQALCLRYVNAAQDPEQLAVARARSELKHGLEALIRRLSWSDFEQLVDLAFARSGWLRVSELGGVIKDVDLVVQQPLTGERIAVQVKSSATQAVIDDYARRLDQRAPGERSMLVCHSPVGPLEPRTAPSGRRLELLLADALSDLAIDSGLTSWIVERAA